MGGILADWGGLSCQDIPERTGGGGNAAHLFAFWLIALRGMLHCELTGLKD
ncbi:MAG: hypothetical protein ACJAVI_003174 [Candidatus Azotimanducaceae bacterium]|jgi:hypothetical protein